MTQSEMVQQETMPEWFRDLAVGFVKYQCEKNHGRPPKYGEITNVRAGGMEIELTEKDFAEETEGAQE